MAHVVLFVALVEEARQVYNTLTEAHFKCGVDAFYPEFREYFFSYSQRHKSDLEICLIVIGDMGNRRVASKIQPFLWRERPVIAIMAGIAGTLNPGEVRLGDVVIAASAKTLYADKIKQIDENAEEFVKFNRVLPADSSIEAGRENKKILVDLRKKVLDESFFRFRRELEIRESSVTPLMRYASTVNSSQLPLALSPVVFPRKNGQGMYENNNPKVHSGTIFGSDFVVDSQEFIDFLGDRNNNSEWDYYTQKNNPDDLNRNRWVPQPLIAVDMETLGFFTALNGMGDSSLVGIAVRGISDQAANKEELDTSGAGVRSIAASNATSVALDMLTYFFSKGIVSAGGSVASPYV